MIDGQENKSPFKCWKNVYAFVIGVLVMVIVSLYFFTRHYQ